MDTRFVSWPHGRVDSTNTSFFVFFWAVINNKPMQCISFSLNTSKTSTQSRRPRWNWLFKPLPPCSVLWGLGPCHCSAPCLWETFMLSVTGWLLSPLTSCSLSGLTPLHGGQESWWDKLISVQPSAHTCPLFEHSLFVIMLTHSFPCLLNTNNDSEKATRLTCPEI